MTLLSVGAGCHWQDLLLQYPNLYEPCLQKTCVSFPVGLKPACATEDSWNLVILDIRMTLAMSTPSIKIQSLIDRAIFIPNTFAFKICLFLKRLT